MIRLFICIGIIWLTLFFHIEDNNALTELRRLIPELEKEVKSIKEENINLSYKIAQFESPDHLMELSRKPEYSHLKYPNHDKIISISETTHAKP